MNVQQYGSFLWQIRYPWFPMNAYLVREEDGFTLIDTMMSARYADALCHQAETLGGSIRRIVLTHGHMDHIGGLARLHSLLPDASVIVGEREARLIAGDLSLSNAEQTHPLRGNYPRVTIKPTAVVRHDDLIGSLQVIETPGHTPGHLSFFDKRDRTMITGDALHTFGRVSVTSEYTWRFPLPAMATWNPVAARTSVQTIADLKPNRIAPGHGPVVEAPSDALAAALTRA
jgi:glyoxylase-like metal-dependent hydrolase (beta-lactamase superfamily II)